MLYDVLSDDGDESFDRGKRKSQKVKKKREKDSERESGSRERRRKTKDAPFERCIIACECQ